jgi:hypothetical protein
MRGGDKDGHRLLRVLPPPKWADPLPPPQTLAPYRRGTWEEGVMIAIVLFEFSTCWESNRRVMQQGCFSHKGDSRVYIELLEKMVVLPLVLFQQSATSNNNFVSRTN